MCVARRRRGGVPTVLMVTLARIGFTGMRRCRDAADGEPRAFRDLRQRGIADIFRGTSWRDTEPSRYCSSCAQFRLSGIANALSGGAVAFAAHLPVDVDWPYAYRFLESRLSRAAVIATSRRHHARPSEYGSASACVAALLPCRSFSLRCNSVRGSDA